MYQVICCPDRKAYSCLPKWLPQDSTSSGERFDLTFALETALRDTLRHTGGVLGLSSVLYKNVNRPHSHSSELPEKSMQMFHDKSGSVHFLLCGARWVWALGVRYADSFQFGVKVCVWVGTGVGVCVCAAADASAGAEEERSGRRQKTKRSSGCTVQSSIK